MLHLTEKYKGDWNAIAESLGRSRIDCIDKMATSTVGAASVGRWGSAETSKLMESVSYQLREKGMLICVCVELALANSSRLIGYSLVCSDCVGSY